MSEPFSGCEGSDLTGKKTIEDIPADSAPDLVSNGALNAGYCRIQHV
jgi:hypothetical protein